jgi:hypothetical protein
VNSLIIFQAGVLDNLVVCEGTQDQNDESSNLDPAFVCEPLKEKKRKEKRKLKWDQKKKNQSIGVLHFPANNESNSPNG